MTKTVSVADFIAPTLTAVNAVGMLTLSWSRLEGALTQWLANETKAPISL